jgi:hypothetical protein
LFNWFVIGEKKNREKNLAEKPPLAEHYCTKLKYVRKQLIINELLVEATGVELFSVLITRKLLIPGTATAAKKAPLPDPLYVYCTKTPSALEFVQATVATSVSHKVRRGSTKRSSCLFQCGAKELLKCYRWTNRGLAPGREACALSFAVAAAGAVWNALKSPAPFCVHASAALMQESSLTSWSEVRIRTMVSSESSGCRPSSAMTRGAMRD